MTSFAFNLMGSSPAQDVPEGLNALAQAPRPLMAHDKDRATGSTAAAVSGGGIEVRRSAIRRRLMLKTGLENPACRARGSKGGGALERFDVAKYAAGGGLKEPGSG
jgi:hypothetical protein